MSLVNQMLRDLESRQRGTLATGGGVLVDIGAADDTGAAPAARPWWPYAALGAAAVALAVGATPDPRPLFAVVGAWLDAGTRPPAVAAETAPVPAGTTHDEPTADDGVAASPAVPAPAAPVRHDVLRLDRTLLTRATRRPAPAPAPVAEPRRADDVLSPELDAVAARFDREFEASLAAAPARPEAPAVASPANAPLATPEPASPVMVKTPVRLTAAERARERHRDALQAIAAGRVGEALAALDDALALRPADGDTRHLLATTLLGLGRIEEAERLLAEAPADTDQPPRLAALRARALVELGREAEALAVLDGQAGAAVDDDFLALHAALMQRLGDHAGAIDLYRRVLANDAGNGVWWMGLAISLEAHGRSGEAAGAYRRALASGSLRADLAAFVEERLAAL